MSGVTVTIRPATEQDLLLLMRALAEFEHYIDVFTVTEDILRTQCFRTVVAAPSAGPFPTGTRRASVSTNVWMSARILSGWITASVAPP